jgi:hypothetical protein
VLGVGTKTFCVEGHHYAIVALTDLDPGTTAEYAVKLDGVARGGGILRTTDPDAELRMRFGSCRVAVPHEEPHTLKKDHHDEGREQDALGALANRMRHSDPSTWPHLLLMIGDQVYVDEDAPETRAFIRARRDTSQPPYDEVLDFEEYCHLYRETWGDPVMQWLLANLPTGMIFDDHDVHDDWNTSQRWVEEMETKHWWHERLQAALMSYWLYQHLGNLSPGELAENELLRRVREVPDGGEILRAFARGEDRHPHGRPWSYSRQLGGVKIVVFDSREGRQLEEGNRRMFDDSEWRWIEDEVSGEFDHVVVADTLPVFFTPAFHYAEAWNEAVAAGAWGKRFARGPAEKLRRAFDMEHWAAFGVGFAKLTTLLRDVATGRRGSAPATVVTIGGDVHHAYLATTDVPNLFQAVCSPFRNPLDRHERLVARIGASAFAAVITRTIARTAGVKRPWLRWRLVQPPTFDNQVATLTFAGRNASLRIERTHPGDGTDPRLETSLEHRLA